ncbi:MAG: ectoine utilization protein EutC [Hoeflea sp.]|uniref:ectoine utilization protein EutC n=1 Tax=Hoeflea sp. TaxID=1940281 RepID=UPI001D4A3F39|nr:ectoine utilization protein EutC [Hoeflea sp.]MBU4531293.1 ectoine utilization protein EutC [Alphaproteobacteria bacterium]MBU4544150.1 ectoine utilization protein EutC [Alphaproteobacteria bacterium]MBU4550613.1 ectoine utilization protein EutC [Alphaproteobacteria bacterium]MBV1724570.1 ectoine utilization protein EutC [Hoeflea sp.]MBV1760590.1 ectoine utilization protein EutC [Hoeflea sp.]
MARIKILAEADLRRAVALDLDAIACIEDAFAALASGEVVMPPILSMAIAPFNGEVDVKTAFVPGIDSFAIKISPGFFDNPKLGLPSTSGLMVLFAARTGMLEALLLDNGYLTDVRTAAAGAVAARHLARADASTACILGAGCQGRLQLKALTLVRPIRSATIWARDAEKAAKAATEMTQELGIEVRAAQDPAAAVREADIIVTTTPATTPVLEADWLRPGQHITAMGSDQEHKNEIDPACFARADLYVPDRLSQTRLLGELRTAIASGVVAAGAEFAELGAIVSGKAAGRTSDDAITIADLTGTGVQDTAIATFALGRALMLEAGADFSN